MNPSALLTRMAGTSSAGRILSEHVAPLVNTLGVLASLVCAFFLVNGGIQYMTSSGKPERLDHAKAIIRNALVGLVIVLAAGALTAILTHAYVSSGTPHVQKLPSLNAIQPDQANGGLVDVLLKAITGVLQNVIQSAAKPFLAALSAFTTSTPLIAENSAVFNLWLVIVGIADALFVLVIALIGFHVMSFSTFGLHEIEFKHVLPQVALMFVLANSSVFLIDAIIGLSNAMIKALVAGFPTSSVWEVLQKVAESSSDFGLAALLIMVAFLVLSVILLVYYVGRIVTLYIGAVLSPLVFLLWLLPGFKDFAVNAMKTYLSTIFVLFVHVVIIALAASLFTSVLLTGNNGAPDPLMSLIIGLATLVALLKTQGVMMQLSYASAGPRTARKLGSQFMNGITYAAAPARVATGAARSVRGKRDLGTVADAKRKPNMTIVPVTKAQHKSNVAKSKSQSTAGATPRPTTTRAPTGTTTVAPPIKPKKDKEFK